MDDLEDQAPERTSRNRRPRRKSASVASSHRLERIVGILAGIGILVFTMALIWRGQPMADPNLARMARIVLALGVGAVGATIPGFLNVRYSAQGLLIRGAGGLAVFLIAFFGSPRIEALHLTNGELTLQPLREMEFRAIDNPTRLSDLDLNAQTAVTLYLKGANSSDQLGRPVEITATSVQVIVGASPPLRFDWKYFGRHITGDDRLGNSPPEVYFGGTGDAGPINLVPGQSLAQTIVHFPQRGDTPTEAWRWQTAVNAAMGGQIRSIRVRVQTLGNGVFETECEINPDFTRTKITEFVARGGLPPRFFQVLCRGERVWTRQSAA